MQFFSVKIFSLFYLTIISWSIGNTIEYCSKVMKYLQEKAYSATVYFEEDSLKKKMNYANKLGVSNVIIIGEDEVANNKVNVKNMVTGKSTFVDYKEL